MSLFSKKPKPVELKKKSSLATRNLVGILLIVIAAALVFVVMPKLLEVKSETSVVAIARADIKSGSVITDKDVSFEERGIYGFKDYIADKEDVIGKQAATDLFGGDIITKNKVGKENLTKLQSVMNEGKNLTTVTVKTNAAGLASHLLPEDTVRVYSIMTDDYNNTVIVQDPLLDKVKVFSVENGEAEEIDRKAEQVNGTSGKTVVSTITLITTKEQELALLRAEYDGSLHVVLVGR